MIVMRAQDDVRIGEHRIRTSQESRDVAHDLILHHRILKIAVAADRLQTCPAELRGDVLGGEVQTSGGRIAPFKKVRRKKRKIPAQGVFGDAVDQGLLLGRKRERCGRQKNETEPRPKGAVIPAVYLLSLYSSSHAI